MVTCCVCGKQFHKHSSEIRKNVGSLHFCSHQCWYQHNQMDRHYGWAGGQNERNNHQSRKWRSAVLERDKHYCRLCHSRSDLQAHHIKRFATHPDLRWDVANGITLCKSCHSKFHGKEEEYERELGVIASVELMVWHD